MTEGEKQTPDWPVQDFLLAYEEALTKRSGRNLAVLVFPGSFSPVHMGHMLMLQQATERLDRAGYDVLAGYIVPMAQTGELSTDFRLKAAALAAAKVPKCEVSPWAIRKGPCKDMEVVQALRAALLEETGMSSKAAPRVRVVAVCGADDTRKFSSLKPQDMLGLCIVPKAGEEEFLLEKPLQQNYVAEAPGGELANLDDKLLAEAISGGDAAFLAQALPEGTRRLVLKPTSQELQRFGADLQKLLPKVPESPWPADKLMSKLLSAGPEGAHTWALLILSDTMAPAMKYHLEILAKARARLEQRGYMVIGMWLSPRTDDKTAEPLSREFRLRAANLMVASEELTMIGTWEMDNGKPSAAQVAKSCRETLVKMFPNSLEGCQLCVFHASSKTMPYRSSDQPFRDNLGCVVVPCTDEDMLLETPSKLCFVAEEFVDVSQKEQLLKQALATGDISAAVEAFGASAARFMLAPSNGEREMQADFKKLGIHPIGNTLLAKTRQNVQGALQNLGLSGALKAEELRRFLRKIDNTLTEEDIQQLLKASPKAQDGSVNGAEFMDWILSSLQPCA